MEHLTEYWKEVSCKRKKKSPWPAYSKYHSLKASRKKVQSSLMTILLVCCSMAISEHKVEKCFKTGSRLFRRFYETETEEHEAWRVNTSMKPCTALESSFSLPPGYQRIQKTVKSNYHLLQWDPKHCIIFNRGLKMCIFYLCIHSHMYSVSRSTQMLRGCYSLGQYTPPQQDLPWMAATACPMRDRNNLLLVISKPLLSHQLVSELPRACLHPKWWREINSQI